MNRDTENESERRSRESCALTTVKGHSDFEMIDSKNRTLLIHTITSSVTQRDIPQTVSFTYGRRDLSTRVLYRSHLGPFRDFLCAILALGADVNARDSSGGTALHAAARKGLTVAVDLLLKRSAGMCALSSSPFSLPLFVCSFLF